MKPDMSAIQKARWADEELRRKASERATARWARPGERERMSAIQKARWAKPGERERASVDAKKRTTHTYVPTPEELERIREKEELEARPRLYKPGMLHLDECPAYDPKERNGRRRHDDCTCTSW